MVQWSYNSHVKRCGDWTTPHLRQHRDPTCIPRPRRFGKRATAVSSSHVSVCASPTRCLPWLPDVSLRTCCRGSEFLYGDCRRARSHRNGFSAAAREKMLCAWRGEIFAGAKRLKTPALACSWGWMRFCRGIWRRAKELGR